MGRSLPRVPQLEIPHTFSWPPLLDSANRRAASSFYWVPVKAGSSAKHILAHVKFQRQYGRQLVIQSVSCVWLFATPWTATCQSSAIFWSLLKFVSIESVMLSNHLILSGPLLLLPSIYPSIRVFSSELVLSIRWPKYGSFSFSISPSNEYSGLNSSKIGWFDLLAVQGTLKSLLHCHNSKASKHQLQLIPI